jgi:plasmid maintenance system killer protein
VDSKRYVLTLTKPKRKNMAAKIHQRIDEITAADSVEVLIQYKIGGCHILKGDRKKQYAMVFNSALPPRIRDERF